MRFYALEKFINLHDGYRRRFQIDHHQLLLVQQAGECVLLEAFCPHRGHPLEVADIDDDINGDSVVRCPLHGYRFRLSDGAVIVATEEPCRGLRRYQIVERETDLGVML